MPENIGGLNYQINIDGNFESVLANFEARIDALQKKSAKAVKSVQAAGQSGTAKRGKSLLSVEEQQEQKSLAKRLSNIQKFNTEKARLSNKAQRGAVTDAQRQNRLINQSNEQSRARELVGLKADIVARNNLRLQEAKAIKATKEGLSSQRAAEESSQAARLKSTKEGLTAQRNAADVGLQATKKNLALQQSLAVKQAQYNQLIAQGNVHKREAAQLVGLTGDQAKRLGINLFDAQQVARQFLFTFRRLVGILAIFTLARKLAQNLGAAVKEMSRFNAEIEIAQIGIASIVASVGQVRDSQGDLVTGADAFAAALAASGKILNQLKKDAIGSIATFEALVKSYQVAIGPGLAAGLDLDQVRILSRRLAEGAISLGVPLNQLSEEIRSLLQGTATARNTRIAVLFGGAKEANEAIRNAKEQGNLYEVLIDRLAGVAQGADAANQSFNVLASNLQDSIQLLLAEGGIQYFDQLKESLLGLTRAITTVGDGGGLVFRPEAVGIVQELAGTLADVVKSFRDVTDTGQTFVFIRNLLASIGDVLKAVAPLASAVFQGLITGVNLALAPIRALLDIVREIARALGLQKANKALAQVVKYVIAGTVGLLLWRKLFVSFPALIAKLLTGLSSIGARFIQIATIQAVAQAETLGIVVGTAAWNVLLTGVVLKMALITGGITIILGTLALLVTKTGLFERLIGKVNNDIGDTADSAESLEHFITSAGDATAEGAKSAKEWADAFKDLERELIAARGLRGLSGQAEELAGLLQDSIKELSEGTEQWRKSNDQIDIAIARTKEEIRLLEERKSLVEGTGTKVAQKVNLASFGSTTPGQSFITQQLDAEKLAVNSLESAQARLKNQQAARLTNEKAIADAKQKQLEILNLQVQIFNQQNPRELESLNTARAESAEQLKIVEALNKKANQSVAELAILKARKDLREDEVALARRERTISIGTAQENLDIALKLNASTETLVGLQRELTKLNEEDFRLFKQEEATLQSITTELEDQRSLIQGGFGDALSAGLEQFTRELPALGEQIAETITGALSDVAGVVADVFKDAIDPRKDVDIQTAFGEFFLNLAGQFVEAITQQLISTAITKIGFGAAEAATDVAETATQTTAITGALASQTTATGIALSAQTAAIVTAIEAAAIVGSVGAASGGYIKGYASGGNIGGIPRPSHIPSSDTVPAWLTPGEFVVKKSMVSKYGRGMLSAINNGVLNPKSFSATGLALGGMVKGVQSFATGGSVRTSAGGSSGQATQTVVLPVLPTTENNLEQIIYGGRGAFSKNVNKVNYIGDPNKSRSW